MPKILNNTMNCAAYIILASCHPLVLCQSIIIPEDIAQKIGRQILLNETGGKTCNLAYWSEHEPFPSFGVGHFIWYPRGVEKRFEETFPQFLRYLKSKGLTVPPWFTSKMHAEAPWQSREEFYGKKGFRDRFMIQQLLEKTYRYQIQFCIDRMEQKRIELIQRSAPDEGAKLERMFRLLTETPAGQYALIDYCNFKGTGMDPNEQYKGQGWGLKQVLLQIPESADSHNAVTHFIKAAKELLKKRVENRPADQRWLRGWMHRVNTYGSF